MKRVSMILILALVLGGGSIGLMSTASQAQVYVPARTVAAPWVGTNTPWVYYNGDWFMKGVLYYFFGNKIGWAPYYAYAPTYIVRPNYWYAPRWHSWYQAHPTYWGNFQRRYPYWHGHRPGQHYNQAFYNRYHHGQGVGWHKGYHPGPHKPGPPASRQHYRAPAGPGHGPKPAAAHGKFQPGSPAYGHQNYRKPSQPAQGHKNYNKPSQPAQGYQGHHQYGEPGHGYGGPRR